MKRKIIVAISALILAMGLASCASFLGAYDLNEKIGLLELGMPKEVVMKGLGEKPFLSLERLFKVQSKRSIPTRAWLQGEPFRAIICFITSHLERGN